MKDIKEHNVHLLFWVALAYLGLIVLWIVPIQAQSGKSVIQSKKPVFSKIAPNGQPKATPLQTTQYWSEQKKELNALLNDTWVNEQWTGNDAPYAAIRSQIERENDAGHQPLAVVAEYVAQAKKEPKNPLAQFAWAYAVHLAVKSTPVSKTMSDLRLAAEVALTEAPPPHSYNYDRLHYLIYIQGAGGWPSYYLRNLGARLLQRDPQDFAVQLGLALIYAQSLDKTAQQHGYVLIQKMIQQYPSKPQSYDTLACWYYTQYICYHNPSDYRQSLHFYDQALNMYPLGSVRRTQLPILMSYLTKRYHQISGS